MNITINEVEVSEKKYLTGQIGKENYSIEVTKEAKNTLLGFRKALGEAVDFKAAVAIIEEALEAVKTFKAAESSDLAVILKDDLYHNAKADTYHIKLGDKFGKDPIHTYFVGRMIEASEKDLDPKPWLIFWVRLMRNPLYNNLKTGINTSKVAVLVEYLKAQYTNSENVDKLVEEGFHKDTATKLSTYDQISITEQGILAAFKYVSLITEKFVVVKDEKTGKQSIEKKDKYEQVLEVDEVTGKVTKDELQMPEFAEEILFAPPIMGTGGDSFSCRDLSEEANTNPGHVIKVGAVHELKSFDQVNCNDSSSGVKGLHLGGYYYVQGFSGRTAFLVDCLIAPEDIGAVCDTGGRSWNNTEGAIRCKRYMVIGSHEHINKGMYHPSAYAKLLDNEWVGAKEEAIEGLSKKIAKVENLL